MKVELTSDITGQKYTGDSYESALESLKKAEQEFAETKQKEEEKSKALAVEKKNLCKEIDECKSAVTKAEESYKEIKTNLQKEYDELIKKYSEVLREAKETEYKARKEYAKKLVDYENKYGRCYTQILRGKDAEMEIDRFIKEFNSAWDSFFRFPF